MVNDFNEVQSEEIADFESRALDSICVNESHLKHAWWYNFKYLLVGTLFGVLLIKGEIISWYRIQEMFRFQSIHMYGVIGSAILTGILSIQVLKWFKVKTIYGEDILIHPKKFNKGNLYGAFIFGMGWGLTGACPGPLFAQIGAGFWIVIVTVLSATAGTWVYGLVRDKLPH